MDHDRADRLAYVEEAAEAIRDCLSEDGGAVYLGLWPPRLEGEIVQGVEIFLCPCAPQVPGQIMRVNLDKLDDVTLRGMLCDAVRVKIGPCLPGGREIHVEETAHGLEILATN